MAVAPYGGTEPRINKQNIIMMMMWWTPLNEMTHGQHENHHTKNHMIICAIERGLEFNVKHTTHRPQYWLRLKSHDNLYISCSAVGFLRAKLAKLFAGSRWNRSTSLSTYLGHSIPGPLIWLQLNRWRRISSPLQSYTHKNTTMHHASEKYKS